jgi:hypothetical protein
VRFFEFQNKDLESALVNTLLNMQGDADFNQEKIVIKTDKEAEDDPEMDFDNQGSTDKVKQMAKSAMNRRK